MNIHPTAIIHPDAAIADDVSVGPRVCIEGPAIIGPGCVIQANAVITGHVRMGSNNHVGYGAIIGAPPQDLSFDPSAKTEVIIGDDNVFREYCTIHRGAADGTATRIGDGNYLMVGSHVAHNASVGNKVIMANNVLLAGHVHIDDRVFMGGASACHQFVRVGKLAIIGGMSKMTKDVPPFTMASGINNGLFGINLIGLRRAGIAPETRRDLKDAFRLVYHSGLNTAQALEKVSQRTWSAEAGEFFEFLRTATRRGICHPPSGRSGPSGPED